MSLEKSMADLAESNIKLAAAQDRLATAQEKVADKYQEMMAFFAANQGGEVATPAATEKAPAEKRGPGRPKKDKPADPPPAADDGLGDDDDGMGDDAPTQRTSDEVKAKLQEFKAAGGVPRDIMSKFGAKAFPELKDADFNAVYEATEKALAKL